MPKRILVFAAHPDDDLIGCGGSLAKRIEHGDEVSVCFMTSGDAGSLEYTKRQLSKIRESEAKKAAKIMGYKKVFFLRNPDGYLEYSKKNIVSVINIIRKERPNVVYVHHENDDHMDHKTTYKIVNECIRRARGQCFQECKGSPWSVEIILSYEVWTPLSEFNYAEDVSRFIDKKIRALEEHRSQIKLVSYDEAAKSLARYRGIMSGCGKYCEVFKILKSRIY